MSTPPPGWYADPAGSELYRWWDGQTWTDALGLTTHARPPLRAAAAGPAEPTGPTGTADPDETAEPDPAAAAASAGSAATTASEASVEPTAAVEPTAPAGPTDPSPDSPAAASTAARSADVRARPDRRGPLAALVVLALVGLAALSTAAILLRPQTAQVAERSADQPAPLSSGATSSSPLGGTAATSSPLPQGSTGGPSGWVNTSTGEARISTASMRLPGEPYRIEPQSTDLRPIFDAAFVANAPVHPSFNANRQSWLSTVALLHVPADQVAGDPASAAQAGLDRVLDWFFGGHAISTKNPRYGGTTVDGRPALRLTREVHYSIPGLASDHDDLTVIVVGLDDGSYAAAVSSVPNDASTTERDLAAASLASLSVR